MWSRISVGIGVLAALVTILVGAIAIHQYLRSDLGKPLMNWSPDALWVFVICVLLLLPWLAIWKAWTVERRLKFEIAAMRAAFNKLSADLAPPATAPLSENELLHEGVVWSWNGHSAQGPRCPRHKEPLVYQNFLRVISTENYEEQFLGNVGSFACLIDREEFPVRSTMKVEQLRAQAAGLFRTRYHVS